VLDRAREEAAKISGMDRQTLRDWVIRFIAVTSLKDKLNQDRREVVSHGRYVIFAGLGFIWRIPVHLHPGLLSDVRSGKMHSSMRKVWKTHGEKTSICGATLRDWFQC
jgi:hypothetical protein